MTKKNALVKADKMVFPKELLVPPSSQLQIYEDKVSSRIRELDIAASQLATGFGIGYTPGMHLDAMFERTGLDFIELFAMAQLPKQRISLERINSNWGLVYSYEPSPMRIGNDRSLRVPLRDAPLEVRERFLQRSVEFFHRYLATCSDRLGNMKTAVDTGDKALEMLKHIELT